MKLHEKLSLAWKFGDWWQMGWKSYILVCLNDSEMCVRIGVEKKVLIGRCD